MIEWLAENFLVPSPGTVFDEWVAWLAFSFLWMPAAATLVGFVAYRLIGHRIPRVRSQESIVRIGAVWRGIFWLAPAISGAVSVGSAFLTQPNVLRSPASILGPAALSFVITMIAYLLISIAVPSKMLAPRERYVPFLRMRLRRILASSR